MTGLPPITLKETFGAKLRRLAAIASNGANRADALHLMPPPAWASGQTILKGNVRSSNGSWYQAITAGTTAGAAPSGGVASSAAVTQDTGVSWVWIGYASVTANDPLAPTSITITASAPSTVVAALTNPWTGSGILASAFRVYGDTWDLSLGWLGLLHGYQTTTYPAITVGATFALNAFGIANFNTYKLTTLGTGVVAAIPSGASTFADANGNVWTYQGYMGKTSTAKVALYVDDYAFAIEFGNYNQFNPLRISIDGRYLSPDGVVVTASPQTYVVFQFATRKQRLVTVEWPQSMSLLPAFAGVVTTPTGRVSAPATRDDVRAMFISDSIFDGSNYGPFIGGNQVGARVSARMGWTDCWQWSLGGTGWVNPGASLTTFGQRIPAALLKNPDIWVFMGSTNDTGYPAATVTAAVTAALQAIRNGGSTAPIVVFGVWSLSGSLATEQAVQAGVIAFADPLGKTFFIPVYQDPEISWITGSWNNGGGPWNRGVINANAVNSNAYVSADGVHPPDPGSDYLANRMVNALNTSVLPLLDSASNLAAPSSWLLWDNFSGGSVSLNGKVPLVGPAWVVTGAAGSAVTSSSGYMGDTGSGVGAYYPQANLSAMPFEIGCKFVLSDVWVGMALGGVFASGVLLAIQVQPSGQGASAGNAAPYGGGIYTQINYTTVAGDTNLLGAANSFASAINANAAMIAAGITATVSTTFSATGPTIQLRSATGVPTVKSVYAASSITASRGVASGPTAAFFVTGQNFLNGMVHGRFDATGYLDWSIYVSGVTPMTTFTSYYSGGLLANVEYTYRYTLSGSTITGSVLDPAGNVIASGTATDPRIAQYAGDSVFFEGISDAAGHDELRFTRCWAALVAGQAP